MQRGRRKFLKTLGAGAAAAGFGTPKLLFGDSAPINVRFWDMRTGPQPSYGKAANDLIARYNAQNPGVQVSFELEEWADWPQLFSLAVASGNAPDLSTGGTFQAVQYYARGDVVDLDDVVADLKRSGQDKDFLPGVLEGASYKGHTVWLPWSVSPRVIFYRKDLFAKAGVKPPGSWDELRAAAKALTSGGQYGFVVAGNEVLGSHCLLLLIMNNGGGLFAPSGELDVMNTRNLEAAKFLGDLVKDGSVNPGSPRFSADDARREFLAGRGAMIVDTIGLRAAHRDLKDQIEALPPPTGPHGDKGTILWVSGVMLYKQSQNPEAAKAFLKWWSANEKPMWTEGHCYQMPARKSIGADSYFHADPTVALIQEEWVPVGKSLASHKPGIFPFLNTLDGYGPILTLTDDLVQGKDVVESMQVAEQRLKTLIANSAYS